MIRMQVAAAWPVVYAELNTSFPGRLLTSPALVIEVRTGPRPPAAATCRGFRLFCGPPAGAADTAGRSTYRAGARWPSPAPGQAPGCGKRRGMARPRRKEARRPVRRDRRHSRRQRPKLEAVPWSRYQARASDVGGMAAPKGAARTSGGQVGRVTWSGPAGGLSDGPGSGRPSCSRAQIKGPTAPSRALTNSPIQIDIHHRISDNRTGYHSKTEKTTGADRESGFAASRRQPVPFPEIRLRQGAIL